jgi:hypothetical protein
MHCERARVQAHTRHSGRVVRSHHLVGLPSIRLLRKLFVASFRPASQKTA